MAQHEDTVGLGTTLATPERLGVGDPSSPMCFSSLAEHSSPEHNEITGVASPFPKARVPTSLPHNSGGRGRSLGQHSGEPLPAVVVYFLVLIICRLFGNF